MPFVKGQSGNPAGRPRGCKNKVNRDFDEELLKKGEYLTDKLIEHFSEGNATALRLVTQRMAPVTKGRPIEIDLPALKSPADRPAAVEVINRALCEGEITIDEASGLIKYVDQALGFDHPAVAKGQLVALTREVAHLRAELAMMAARLDAEFGVDNINMESIDARVRESLSGGDPVSPTTDSIDAESTSNGVEADADALAASEADDARGETPAAIDRIKAESIAGAEAPYGTRPVPMTIGEDVLALMRELEQGDTELPDRIDAAGSVRPNEAQRRAA